MLTGFFLMFKKTFYKVFKTRKEGERVEEEDVKRIKMYHPVPAAHNERNYVLQTYPSKNKTGEESRCHPSKQWLNINIFVSSGTNPSSESYAARSVKERCLKDVNLELGLKAHGIRVTDQKGFSRLRCYWHRRRNQKFVCHVDVCLLCEKELVYFFGLKHQTSLKGFMIIFRKHSGGNSSGSFVTFASCVCVKLSIMLEICQQYC